MSIGTFTDLNATEGYADNTKLTEAQLNTMVTSVETYVNTTVMRNIEQLAKDCFGNANYTFDSDGSANFTNTLFNKQTATDYYNGGDITIGTSSDAAWANVDAVNASIAITPEVIGKYKVTAHFTHVATSTATTLMDVDVSFRITDGTDASYSVNSGGKVAALTAGSGIVRNPVTLTYIFDWVSTTVKTITIQKYNRTCTDVSANVVAATAATGEIYLTVEKV